MDKFGFKNSIFYQDSRFTGFRKIGEIQGKAERSGESRSLMDGLIISVALVNDLKLVTRNVKDMRASGVKILNPWDD
ncbi:MAG: hypothetical protein DWQ10_11725 [Calditrichaeota bacterium]|nr:MAG: hypothetical protein DWQ10_11725 [Calditrichota bacterium]